MSLLTFFNLNLPSEIPTLLSSSAEAIILALMLLVILNIIFVHNLLANTISMSLFSLLVAAMYLLMNAPDVAMTEAAINACITTIFAVCAILITSPDNNLLNFESRIKYSPAVLLLCFAVGALLSYIAINLPEYGKADTPVHSHVGAYYIKNSGTEIGIPAIIASTLASYRGFDTLGESLVILTAGLCMFLLIGSLKKDVNKEECRLDDSVPYIIAKFMIPFILLYAFYIQLHGEQSPGGGFQAGAILASGFMLYGIVFGQTELYRVLSLRTLKLFGVVGVLIYALTGIASFYFGGEYLNYSALHTNSILGQHIGIFLIEIGVGITVASVLLAIFGLLASKTSLEKYKV